MKKYLAYTRVSTTRQGEQGVSLQQQRESIERFATKAGLEICEWLEEQETAAKQGRPVFLTVLKRLRQEQVAGVIMHKIDRSARNLKDWAELGQLIDQGIEVHFSNEAVDLKSRGGRLSADIQAVVAADYIRNLREEVKKGFYGRLQQGITPLPAPLGYLNPGAGKAKTIDPIAGPIISQAFDLYASGRYTQAMLTTEVNRLGLRTRGGSPVGKNVVARILSNRFYTGVIQIRKTGQTYKGLHEPLTSLRVFERVQMLLKGRAVRGPGIHNLKYSRLITCQTCGRSLVGELHKGHVYYRCHIRTCPATSLREDLIDRTIIAKLDQLELTEREIEWLEELAAKATLNARTSRDADLQRLRLQAAKLDDRQNRLTDAFVDGALERSDYDKRKAALVIERCDLDQRLASVEAGQSEDVMVTQKKLELVKRAWLLHKSGISSETRDLVSEVTSNRVASGKTLVITLQNPLEELLK